MPPCKLGILSPLEFDDTRARSSLPHRRTTLTRPGGVEPPSTTTLPVTHAFCEPTAPKAWPGTEAGLISVWARVREEKRTTEKSTYSNFMVVPLRLALDIEMASRCRGWMPRIRYWFRNDLVGTGGKSCTHTCVDFVTCVLLPP